MKIIDIHVHIGDGFHDNKNITFKTGIKKGNYPDPFLEIEESGYTKPLVVESMDDMQVLINAGQYRTWEATLENLAAELDKYDFTYACALPIMPNTTFEEYLAASMLEPRVLPFTCPDFDLPISAMEAKLKKDIDRGAKGVKIHSILQNVSFEDDRTAAAVEVCGKEGLPITFHVGVTPYYGPNSPHVNKQNPEYGEPRYFYEFARRFPQYNLIAAHCCTIIDEFAAQMGDLENVYTDTTMCSAELMRKGVELLGENRLLFGTDHPFGTLGNSSNEVKRAFKDKPDVMEKVFYGNAAKLLKL